MIRIIFLLLGLFPFIAEAESFDMGIFHYDTLESNPDEVSITYYTGPDEFQIFEIPESVEYNGKTYKVTEIARIEPVRGTTYPIIIPNTIKTIARNAFNGNTSLIGNLIVPSSVTTIGENAFGGCTGFTGDLIIPLSVTTIGAHAFYGCTGFTGDLIIPSSVTEIGRYAFQKCTGFSGTLTIPPSLKKIDDGSFYGCSGFNKLVISAGVAEIGISAFEFCEGFSGCLKIPDTVKIINERAFMYCNHFDRLLLGNSVSEIGMNAFYGCNRISGEIVFPESVMSIGGYAFKYCDHIQSLVFTYENVTIGALAFPDNNGLEYIVSQSETPPNAELFAFPKSAYDKPLYVPEKSISLYKNAVEWRSFKYVNPISGTDVTLTLNVKSLTLNIGQTEKLTATILPENTSDKTVTWASDNEAIATVAADGTVTGVSVGVANITAKCGDVSATCKVTVNPVPAATVTINVPDTKIYVGDKLTLSAMVAPDNTTDKTLIWTCSTPEIATINAQTGELTAIAPGEARIKATCGEATGMATVTIIPVPATSVTISTDDITLLVGQTGKLTATVFPENTTDKNIVWESDNDAIATVTYDGTVTAVSIGVTNITATCGDVTSTCKVTVIPRIEAPIDFVRKGNGTSCTFIVMMNLSDAQLAQKGYKFVYGYTDIQGSEHIMTTTNLRYCHTTPEVYNNNGNDFWVYAFLTNDDGTIVCSTRRHLDGRIDIEANARMLSHYLNRLANIYNPENWITATSHGAQLTLPCAENAFVTVHAINGTFMFKRNYENGIEIIDEITSSHLVPSIYIVTVSCGDTTTSKKITIR